MAKLPFGVSRLDDLLGGGAPPGNTVLLVGEPGAGAREFLHTCVGMNGLAGTDPDLFDLHYGDLHQKASAPEDIHYLSFTTGPEYLEREMRYTLDDEIVDAAMDDIRFDDLSSAYFRRSPIPREWYAGETRSVADLGKQRDHDSVFEALGARLSEHGSGSLVVVDSVTDLVGAVSEEMGFKDVTMLLKGLSRTAYDWGGLVLLLVNRRALTETQLGQLSEAAGGTFVFEWESGGSQRARTMVVEQFRGVLSRLEEENIVRFETEIHEAGFDISDVRKIR